MPLRRPGRWFAAALAAAGLLLAGGCADSPFGEPKPKPPRPPGEPGVVRERPLVDEGGGNLDWCHATNRIAFDRGLRSGVSEVFTIDPLGKDERCVTCEARGLPKGLRGHPSWHPSCRWLVLQVSNRHTRGGRYEQLAWGIHHDLWAVAADGAWAAPLVTVGALGASLAPHVARDGGRLVWSVRRPTGRRIPQKTGQRTPGAEDPWDGWHIAVAGIESGPGGRPRLRAPTALFADAPGGGFYQADALVADTLWYSHSTRGEPYVNDVFRVKLSGVAPENMTRSPGVWDALANPSPGGRLVAWVSSAASGWRHPPDLASNLRLELFVFAPGGGRSRISALNDVIADAGTGRAVAGDHAWGPGGNQIALAYTIFGTDGTLARRIEVIELDEPH